MLDELIISVTTDASGNAEVNASRSIFGTVYAVEISNGDLDAGSDITITVESRVTGVNTTLLTLTNVAADAMIYVRELAQGNTGANLTGIYAEPIAAGTVQVTIAEGGITKSGQVVIYYNDYSS